MSHFGCGRRLVRGRGGSSRGDASPPVAARPWCGSRPGKPAVPVGRPPPRDVTSLNEYDMSTMHGGEVQSRLLPQPTKRAAADSDEFRVRVLASASESGQGVEGTQVPGEPVFGWAEQAPVAVEERISQVRPAWPSAEPEAVSTRITFPARTVISSQGPRIRAAACRRLTGFRPGNWTPGTCTCTPAP